MKVMNLILEFEMKKMKESDAVKDYGAQLLSIADKVRLLGFPIRRLFKRYWLHFLRNMKLQFPLWRIQRICQLLA